MNRRDRGSLEFLGGGRSCEDHQTHER
jgi:hypothetical protein